MIERSMRKSEVNRKDRIFRKAQKSSEKYSGLNSETEPKLTKKAMCVSFTQLKMCLFYTLGLLPLRSQLQVHMCREAWLSPAPLPPSKFAPVYLTLSYFLWQHLAQSVMTNSMCHLLVLPTRLEALGGRNHISLCISTAPEASPAQGESRHSVSIWRINGCGSESHYRSRLCGVEVAESHRTRSAEKTTDAEDESYLKKLSLADSSKMLSK